MKKLQKKARKGLFEKEFIEIVEIIQKSSKKGKRIILLLVSIAKKDRC
ncbi:MAG: hypothetical protein AABX98_01705 [Nanoarchaeota archaeon]